MVHGLQNAFSKKNGFITVAEFHGFVNAGGGTGGDGGATHRTSLGININFNGGVAS